MAPGGAVELDPRGVPWPLVRRLALRGGLLPPATETIGRHELALLLRRAAAGGAAADPRERHDLEALLAWLEPPASGRSGLRAGGGLRLDGRELGDAAEGEAGLALAGGLSVALEPRLDAWRGALWATAAPRLAGRAAGRAATSPDLLLYPGWRAATGRTVAAGARRDDGDLRLDWPFALAGARLGGWSLTAGLAPRRDGPGLGGALGLDREGPSLPAVTLRRVAPFRWRGWLRPLQPAVLLVRAGLASERDLAWVGESGRVGRRDRPWFLQWMLGFEPAGWLRASVAHAALAAPREGTLWPDLLQVGFPLLSATWNETQRGPLTDRIFSLQMEARWRGAPWPLLPAAAGRAWLEYAGEDYRPDDRLGFLPELAAPATVAGVELIGRSCDLALEWADLEHPRVLWYSHEAIGDGYTHRGWPLGHRSGGGARSLSGSLRWRPGTAPWEVELAHERTRWATPLLPGEAEREAARLTLRRPAGRLGWELSVWAIREQVEQAGRTQERSWPAAALALELR